MKKRISLVLVLMIVLAMGTSVFATATPGGTDDPARPAQSQVELTGEATLFSVTVPMVLPLEMKADRSVVTTPGTIINNSYGPVEIVKEEINAANGWTLVSYGTDMKDKNVGSNLLGFCLNGNEITATTDGNNFVFYHKGIVPDSGNYSDPASRVIPGIVDLGEKSSFHINYRAKVPARSETITDTVVAHVVFTFAWDKTD